MGNGNGVSVDTDPDNFIVILGRYKRPRLYYVVIIIFLLLNFPPLYHLPLNVSPKADVEF